jgi:hypothetical protein
MWTYPRIIAPALAISALTLSGYAAGANERAKAAIARQFVDPESTRFRNVFQSQDIETGNRTFVCGELNTKNRMGGYVGYTRFLIEVNGRGEIAFDTPNSSTFANKWYDFCGNRRLN